MSGRIRRSWTFRRLVPDAGTMFRSERFVAAFGAIALSLSAMAADAPSYEASRIDLPDAYRPGAINRHGDMAGIKRLDVQAR